MVASHLLPLIYRSRGSPTGARFSCSGVDVGRSLAAPVSSAAPKKKSFDRGGPVWPPRSNVTNDRLRGGVWGAAPPRQIFSKKRTKKKRKKRKFTVPSSRYLTFQPDVEDPQSMNDDAVTGQVVGVDTLVLLVITLTPCQD